jgi:hypothetical protein
MPNGQKANLKLTSLSSTTNHEDSIDVRNQINKLIWEISKIKLHTISSSRCAAFISSTGLPYGILRRACISRACSRIFSLSCCSLCTLQSSFQDHIQRLINLNGRHNLTLLDSTYILNALRTENSLKTNLRNFVNAYHI